MEYSSSNLISFVYKNWKPLVVIPFLSMVVAVVFSGPTFIKPLFESQVILIYHEFCFEGPPSAD